MGNKKYTIWVDEDMMNHVDKITRNRSKFIRKAVEVLLEGNGDKYREEQRFWSRKQKRNISFILELLRVHCEGTMNKIELGENDGLIVIGNWKRMRVLSVLMEYFFKRNNVEMYVDFSKGSKTEPLKMSFNSPDGITRDALNKLYEGMG